jgi:microcystin-dependent protein
MTTPYKGLPLPVQGVTTTWGDALNNYAFTYIDEMLGAITTKTLASSPVVLTAAESRSLALRLIGTITADVLVTTACQGFTLVENLTSGAFSVSLTNSATVGGTAVGTPVVIPQGGGYIVLSDVVNGSRTMLPVSASGSATVGRIADFPGTTVPYGWLKLNGALVSRASYPALWTFATLSGNLQTDANWVANAMYGAFSSGDGSTTFRLPDVRGYFRRSAADDATGSQDYGRATGSFQNQSVANHIHPTSITDPGHRHFQFNTTQSTSTSPPPITGSNYPIYSFAASSFYSDYTIQGGTVQPTLGLTSLDITNISVTIQNNSGGTAQNRPENVAFMTCISYV